MPFDFDVPNKSRGLIADLDLYAMRGRDGEKGSSTGRKGRVAYIK